MKNETSDEENEKHMSFLWITFTCSRYLTSILHCSMTTVEFSTFILEAHYSRCEGQSETLSSLDSVTRREKSSCPLICERVRECKYAVVG